MGGWHPLLRPLPRDWSTPLQEYVNLRGSEASLDAPTPHTDLEAPAKRGTAIMQGAIKGPTEIKEITEITDLEAPAKRGTAIMQGAIKGPTEITEITEISFSYDSKNSKETKIILTDDDVLFYWKNLENAPIERIQSKACFDNVEREVFRRSQHVFRSASKQIETYHLIEFCFRYFRFFRCLRNPQFVKFV